MLKSEQVTYPLPKTVIISLVMTSKTYHFEMANLLLLTYFPKE